MNIRISAFIFKNSVLLTLVWTLIIFVLCATPGQYIPSADWLELLSFDKFVHASMFFILTSLLFSIAINRKKSPFIFARYFFTAVAYGASLELMQAYWFSNRSADWKDMAANTFGCLMAVLFLRRLRKVYAQLAN